MELETGHWFQRKQVFSSINPFLFPHKETWLCYGATLLSFLHFFAGLNRCGKSCRLRWTNYLRPDLKHDSFTPQEEELIINLHGAIGSRYIPLYIFAKMLQWLHYIVWNQYERWHRWNNLYIKELIWHHFLYFMSLTTYLYRPEIKVNL